MQLPLQVAFHNMRHSDQVVRTIEDHVAHLETFYDRITACRVVVDMPHKHHESGNLYQVRIDLTVPGREIVVNRESSQQTQFKDLDAALGHAFDVAARQLEEFARQRHAKVKHHEPLPHARVTRLNAAARYGFLETPDGREVYFPRQQPAERRLRAAGGGHRGELRRGAGREGPAGQHGEDRRPAQPVVTLRPGLA
jgi:ribosome-associated translation inhibitor RaiA